MGRRSLLPSMMQPQPNKFQCQHPSCFAHPPSPSCKHVAGQHRNHSVLCRCPTWWMSHAWRRRLHPGLPANAASCCLFALLCLCTTTCLKVSSYPTLMKLQHHTVCVTCYGQTPHQSHSYVFRSQQSRDRCRTECTQHSSITSPAGGVEEQAAAQ